MWLSSSSVFERDSNTEVRNAFEKIWLTRRKQYILTVFIKSGHKSATMYHNSIVLGSPWGIPILTEQCEAGKKCGHGYHE